MGTKLDEKILFSEKKHDIFDPFNNNFHPENLKLESKTVALLGNLFQRIESLETKFEKRDAQYAILQKNYEDLTSSCQRSVEALQGRVDDYQRKYTRCFGRISAKYMMRLKESEKSTMIENSKAFTRIEEVEETCLRAVHENEEFLLVEMKSVKEILSDCINQNTRVQPLSRPAENLNSTFTRLEMKQQQLENTISMSPLKNKTKSGNDVIIIDIKSEEMEGTEKQNDKRVEITNDIVVLDIEDDSQRSTNCVQLVVDSKDDEAVGSDSDEYSSSCVDIDDETENVGYESDMCVEVATVDSELTDIFYQSDLSDHNQTLNSRFEILSQDWCVYRWNIEQFHDIQFNGFDIFSPQFSFDGQANYELRISWFDELKESICIDLIQSGEQLSTETTLAVLTCEGNGSFNSTKILANVRPKESFLSIDRSEVEITEQCNSKTLCDFIENNTLFINCYFRRC